MEKEQAETSKSKATDKIVAYDQEKPLASSKVPTGRRERERNDVFFGICLSILSVYDFESQKIRTFDLCSA